MLTTYIISICLALSAVEGGAGMAPTEADTLRAVFWNLENFFDCEDSGGGTSDAEFTPDGLRRWTKGRFYAKCKAVSKALFWIAGEMGGLPDIIGLAEIENRRVLSALTGATLLYKGGYGIVHYDSPDHRGIDTALLYRKSTMKLEESRPLHIYSAEGEILPTRDILYARFTHKGEEKSFLVCHFPSKFSGKTSSGRREAAMDRLCQVTDSLHREGHGGIVAMGDFNDGALSPLFSRYVEGCSMRNLAAGPASKGCGTIRYNGLWEMIDIFFTEEGDASGGQEMRIFKVPFLLCRDKAFPGDKPLRTYIGPRYNDGVSDHLPIGINLPI